jgi:hypothetical protein
MRSEQAVGRFDPRMIRPSPSRSFVSEFPARIMCAGPTIGLQARCTRAWSPGVSKTGHREREARVLQVGGPTPEYERFCTDQSGRAST